MTRAWSTVQRCRATGSTWTPSPAPGGAPRRTTAVPELDQRRGGVLPEQMPPEAAFGEPHPGVSGARAGQQRQVRRRQQRRLADLAADLEHEAGVQRLPAAGVRADQAPALGDAHVHRRAGPLGDEPLQGVPVGQALVHHDLGRRLGHQPGQAGQVVGGDRLLERPDPDRAQLADDLQGLLDVPGHVGVDPKVDPAAEQPPSGSGRPQGPVLLELELDVGEPEGAHLEQRHRIGPSLAGGHHPAVAVSPKGQATAPEPPPPAGPAPRMPCRTRPAGPGRRCTRPTSAGSRG